MKFEPVELSVLDDELRQEAREWIAATIPTGSFRPGQGLHGDIHSPEFSRKLAERGWVGMSIDPAYGGGGRSPLDRFIVLEELLRVGAPIGAHAVAERQTVPMLMLHGTQEQRDKFLPAIRAGEAYFSVGMSEPNAGSDLAGVRTKATRVEGGWSLSGTKIWTSGAHQRPYCIVFCRTEPPSPDDRHAGFSQLLVDLRGPNITMSPIHFMDGSHQFNEVVFDNAFVPDSMVLGKIGNGWNQVMQELSLERAGPERIMSTWPVLEAFLLGRGTDDDGLDEVLGRIVARLWIIRQMSLSLTQSFAEGSSLRGEGAIVKDLGTNFEQELVAGLLSLIDEVPELESPERWETIFAEAMLMTPSTTIRGGTIEVLRSIVARAARDDDS